MRAVAKRSVKRTRQQTAARPASAPAPAPPAGGGSFRRAFWLGALVAAALLIPAGIVATVLAAGSDASAPAAPQPAGSDDTVESEAEVLRRQTQVRDREQVRELTERMGAIQGDLAPVLDGLARTFPPGEDRTGPVAGAADVREWLSTVEEADAYFEDPPSGETGTNIARGGFAAAVDALLGATRTYALALDGAGDRDALLERAREQRDLAVRTWSVAATQLDAINIATGFGHQHVYLGGTEQAGGFGSDGAPEGSGAE